MAEYRGIIRKIDQIHSRLSILHILGTDEEGTRQIHIYWPIDEKYTGRPVSVNMDMQGGMVHQKVEGNGFSVELYLAKSSADTITKDYNSR